MPAATWKELQDFELQFDAALAGSAEFALSPASPILSVFSAAPYTFSLYPQQATDTLVAPRLEYQFTLGQPTGPSSQFQLESAGDRAVAFNFTLLFRFVYDRKKLTEDQRPFKGELRELFAPPAANALESAAFNSTTLPWLNITALNEVRAVRGIVRDEEKAKSLDAWESSWEGVFNIRPDVIPV